ncbi:Fc.00g095300.m01.CDS01, partial [Cosmosporella sp. VM-42]
MEVVGGTASVIAVVDIAAKVIVLCSNYLTAVSKARYEISRLQEQVKCLQTILQDAAHLLETPDGRLLSTSRKLDDALKKCRYELDEVHDKLEPGTARKTMRRVGFRALKWPFKKGDVEAIVASLISHRDTIATGLQIDQTTLLHHISRGIENLSLQTTVDVSLARKPHFIMPFPRDPDFVERPALQTWIELQCAGPASRMALVGLGGFG